MSTAKAPSVITTVLIILGCVVFDVALHRFSAWMFNFNYFNNGLPQSVLVKNGTFPIAALLGFSAMFGFLTLIYYRSRSEIGCTRSRRPRPAASRCGQADAGLTEFSGEGTGWK